MKAQIVRNLFSNYGVNVVGMALGILLVPFLIRKLGVEAFGLIALAESTIGFFEIGTISVRIALSRHAAYSLAKGKAADFSEYLSTGRCLLFVSAAVVLFAGLALAWNFDGVFRVPAELAWQSRALFSLIVIAFALTVPNIVFWSALYAKERFDLINLSLSFSLIFRAAALFGLFTFLPKEHVSLVTYGLVYLGMTVIQNVLVRIWQKSVVPEARIRLAGFRREKVREILSLSGHTSISRLSTLLYDNTANFIINLLWGPAANAVYSVSLKAPQILKRLFMDTTWTLTPTFTGLVARGERERFVRLLFLYTKAVAAFTAPLCIGLMAFSHDVIRVWVGPGFELAGDILPILVLPIMVAIPLSVCGCVTNAYAKVKVPSLVSLSAAVLNVALGLFLGVTLGWGVYGIAGAAALMSLAYSSVFAPAYACRIARVPYGRFLGKSVLEPFALAAVATGLPFMALRSSDLPLEAKAAIAAAALGVYFFAASRKLLNAEERRCIREILPWGRPFIRLESMEQKGSRIDYRFSTNLPYFRKQEFFVEYDSLPEPLPEGVKAIPFAAMAAPIAWAAGADVEMGELDRRFAASLDRAREYFRRWFAGRWAFSGSLDARLVDHGASPERTGMLFSSGLDSLASYARHQASNPVLFTIFGADVPLSHSDFIALCRERLDGFAAAQAAEIRFIRTDVREAIHDERLRRFSKSWYGEVAHGLLMTSLVAPSSHQSVKRLLVASCSHRPGCTYPCGSERELVQSIGWASTSLENDAHDVSRARKISAYLKERPDLCSAMRVCWMQFRSLNCGRCEKCLRTICELLASGIDPVACNFAPGADTLPGLRRRMESAFYFFFKSDSVLDFWRDLQDSVDAAAVSPLYGAPEFFKWFKNYDRLRRRPSPVLRAACSALTSVRDGLSHVRRAARRTASARAGRAVPVSPRGMRRVSL